MGMDSFPGIGRLLHWMRARISEDGRRSGIDSKGFEIFMDAGRLLGYTGMGRFVHKLICIHSSISI